MKICPLCGGEVKSEYVLDYACNGDIDPTVKRECQECRLQW